MEAWPLHLTRPSLSRVAVLTAFLALPLPTPPLSARTTAPKGHAPHRTATAHPAGHGHASSPHHGSAGKSERAHGRTTHGNTARSNTARGNTARGHTTSTSRRRAQTHAASTQAFAPPLVLRTPILRDPALRAPAVPTPAATAPLADAAAVPAPPQTADPVTVDEGALHTVGEQLARGGSALQFPGALRKFFQALRQREQNPGNGTVRILQFGDSHTAADLFTGEARARMQARFGDGGIGFSYAGHPFAGYRIFGSGRGQSGSWQTLGTHFTQLGDAELGLGGVALQSNRPGDTVSLDAPCLTLDVQYLRQPGGGSLQLSDNGAPVEQVSTSTGASTTPATTPAGVTDAYLPQPSGLPASAPTGTDPYTNPTPATAPFRAPAPAPAASASPATAGNPVTPGSSAAGTLRLNCTAGTHRFALTTLGGGPVRLLGTVALQPGITWESIGINGAEAPLILRWNQPLFRAYLASSNPDLIVLAYGTNEAAARWSAEEYRATFARLIDLLHTVAPAASILVVGPADRSLGSTSYTVTGRGRRARRIAHRYFSTFGGTARIVNAQREVCRTHDCAFWDWQARQGGPGAMNRWVAAAYAQPDHTHFTGTGYRALADALIADLLSAYSGYTGTAGQ